MPRRGRARLGGPGRPRRGERFRDRRPTSAAADAEWCGAWKGARVSKRSAGREEAGDGVHGRHLQRVLLDERRKDRGQPLREEGLAGSGRTLEQQVVCPGGSDLEGVPTLVLAGDVAELGQARRLAVAGVRHPLGPVELAAERPDDLAQMGHGEHLDPRDQGGLPRVGGRDHDSLAASGAGRKDSWQHAANRADAAIEPELAQAAPAEPSDRRVRPPWRRAARPPGRGRTRSRACAATPGTG